MKTPLFLSFALFVSLVSVHAEAADAEGFTIIYDGKDLSKIKTEGNWMIQEDGSLHLEPRPGEEGWKRYGSYIWLKEDYADFVFDFEFKYGKGGNSGFYFRCADEIDPTKSGFEVQILDSYGVEKELGHHDMGGVIKTNGPLKNMSKPAGEWNRMVVTMKGDNLHVVLNGEVVQDINLAEKKPEDKTLVPSGKICIQDHGQPFTVRNLRVKRL
ncbi:MAG: DUF1080 domain-containing protein [Verrucomicrobiota bacterium]